MDNKKIYEYLYPNGENNDEVWEYKKFNVKKSPAKEDAKKIYNLIKQIIYLNKIYGDIDMSKLSKEQISIPTNKNFEDNSKDIEIKDFLVEICTDYKQRKENIYKFGEIKVDIIKGSIYKIKKYFMEDSNLKDIRGGSKIIDYLNNEFVKIKLKEIGLSEDNIIYTGGGNILLVVPKGLGKVIGKEFEEEYQKIAITIMCAFESIEKTLNEFAFEFSNIINELNQKITERSKLKVYDCEVNCKADDELYGIEELVSKEKNYFKIESEKVCDLCKIRNAKYEVKEDENKKVCLSCLKKHLVGKEKEVFYTDYMKKAKCKMNYDYKKVKSIDDIDKDKDKEVAIIYGDGNNMGNFTKMVSNVFEMMYFSRTIDYNTKMAVYEAIKNSMGEEARFEVVALGGDDIFIIVPAKHAFKISIDIVKYFGKKYDNNITMSIGMVITKSKTPISTSFEIAQDLLKNAKKFLKKKSSENPSVKEGSIDVVELIGGTNDIYQGKGQVPIIDIESEKVELISKDKEQRLFPITISQLEKIIEIMKSKKKDDLKTQLHKMDFAKANMSEEEFNLFYFYQNAKNRINMDEFIKDVTNNKGCSVPLDIGRETPYKIDWSNLILLYERGEI